MKSLIAAMLLAASASAEQPQQPACARQGEVERVLAIGYGEQVIETDVVAGIVWRLWANPETKSWTITGTKNGKTCVFRSGPDYHSAGFDEWLDRIRDKAA